MKVKPAVFNDEYGVSCYLKIDGNGTCWADGHESYTRITENLEVDFTPLPRDIIVKGELKKIDAAEDKLRGAFSAAMAELENRRQNLLALPNKESDNG